MAIFLVPLVHTHIKVQNRVSRSSCLPPSCRLILIRPKWKSSWFTVSWPNLFFLSILFFMHYLSNYSADNKFIVQSYVTFSNNNQITNKQFFTYPLYFSFPLWNLKPTLKKQEKDSSLMARLCMDSKFCKCMKTLLYCFQRQVKEVSAEWGAKLLSFNLLFTTK